jgi:hypothetical protein
MATMAVLALLPLAAACGGSGNCLSHGLRRRGTATGSRSGSPVYVYNYEGTIGVGADAEDGRGDHSRAAYVFGDSPRCKLLAGSSEQVILMPDLFEPRKAGSTYGQLRSLLFPLQIARGRASVRIAFAVIQATF